MGDERETFRELMARDPAAAASKFSALVEGGKSGAQIAEKLGPVDVRTCRRWARELREAGHAVPELPRGPRGRRVRKGARLPDPRRGFPPERSREVLEALKAPGATQAAVARRFGVSRQAVSAVAARAS